MSADLYEVVSLAARYLFAFLGVVIVLRSFLWLAADRAEKHRRIRRLPDAGSIGELVVLSGSPELPEGTSLPVPWEGVLGSVRSCDIPVPCPGVRKRHLRFSYQTGKGLQIFPASGCEAAVDSVALNCHSGERGRPMVHGSFLQVGSALLRLRVFAGLDSAAGFDPSSVHPPEPLPSESGGYGMAGIPSAAPTEAPPYVNGVPPAEGSSAGDSPLPAEDGSLPEQPPAESGAGRKRRSAGWEEDWSE